MLRKLFIQAIASSKLTFRFKGSKIFDDFMHHSSTFVARRSIRLTVYRQLRLVSCGQQFDDFYQSCNGRLNTKANVDHKSDGSALNSLANALAISESAKHYRMVRNFDFAPMASRHIVASLDVATVTMLKPFIGATRTNVVPTERTAPADRCA